MLKNKAKEENKGVEGNKKKKKVADYRKQVQNYILSSSYLNTRPIK